MELEAYLRLSGRRRLLVLVVTLNSPLEQPKPEAFYHCQVEVVLPHLEVWFLLPQGRHHLCQARLVRWISGVRKYLGHLDTLDFYLELLVITLVM
jgi:hypothetical protein